MMMHTLFASTGKQLITCSYQTIDPELIEDRKVLWRHEVNCAQDLLGWMKLMVVDDMQNWSQVILKDMECDEKHAGSWQTSSRTKIWTLRSLRGVHHNG